MEHPLCINHFSIYHFQLDSWPFDVQLHQSLNGTEQPKTKLPIHRFLYYDTFRSVGTNLPSSLIHVSLKLKPRISKLRLLTRRKPPTPNEHSTPSCNTPSPSLFSLPPTLTKFPLHVPIPKQTKSNEADELPKSIAKKS